MPFSPLGKGFITGTIQTADDVATSKAARATENSSAAAVQLSAHDIGLLNETQRSSRSTRSATPNTLQAMVNR